MRSKSIFYAAAMLIFAGVDTTQSWALDAPKSVAGRHAYLVDECPRVEALFGRHAAQPHKFWRADSSTEESPAVVGAVIGAFAEPLISFALNGVQTWLNKKAKDKSASVAGFTANGVVLRRGPTGKLKRRQCLVLISGDFVDEHSTDAEPPIADSALKSGEWSTKWLAAFSLSKAPDIYMEIETVFASDWTALRLQARYLEYRRSGLSVPNRKSRALAVTINGFERGVPLAPAVLSLSQRLLPGQMIYGQHLFGAKSPWIKINLKTTKEGQIDIAAALRTPFSVQATIVETTKAREIDVLLANLFGAIRKPIQSTAVEAAKSFYSGDRRGATERVTSEQDATFGSRNTLRSDGSQ